MVRHLSTSMRLILILAASLGAASSVGVVGMTAARAVGKHCACAHCGCAQCCKTCRVVCEEKQVEVVCWGAKCEDFCVPGKSCEKCKHCKCVCGDCGNPCDCTVPTGAPKPFVWRDWVPAHCATIFTRTKLMKKTITVTVPSYKWVVEDLCPGCSEQCGARVCDEATCAVRDGELVEGPMPLPSPGDELGIADSELGLVNPSGAEATR